ncbi:MAG: DUF3794 domain-containing protein [Cellulosilyticaceae bacterium]
MVKTMRDLIEYYGICKYTYEEIPHFREFNLDYMLYLPEIKADIDQIVKVWVTPYIVGQKVIVTPIGTSLEGYRSTGYKLIVTGDVRIKIEYVALQTEQGLHTTQVSLPFSTYITLPERFNQNAYIKVTPLIQDICSDLMDRRCIYNNMTMMVIADIC